MDNVINKYQVTMVGCPQKVVLVVIEMVILVIIQMMVMLVVLR